MNDANKYEQRGVSSAKNEVKTAIKNLSKGLYPKAFCKVIPDVLNDNKKSLFGPSYCNIMHADGAGTKAVLAYLYWKETGDLSVWKGIAQDAIVMNTDDLICAGATNNMVLTSTIGRNKFRIPGEVIAAIIEGTQEFCDLMAKERIDITFAGGETADMGDSVRTIVVDSTVSTRLKRSDVISGDRIQPGDLVIGLASAGQTKYEHAYCSGIGSNGLTSARHDVLCKDYAAKYPESYDDQVDASLIYSGDKHLTDATEVPGMNVGQLLLSPTRTYAPVMKTVLESFRPSVHGIIHCSGGAQTKVLNFIGDNIHVVKDNLFKTPPVFTMIQASSQTPWEEMYKVFNMGHRMELYVKENIADEIIKIARYYDLDAQVIGRCEAGDRKQVTVKGEHGTYTY